MQNEDTTRDNDMIDLGAATQETNGEILFAQDESVLKPNRREED